MFADAQDFEPQRKLTLAARLLGNLHLDGPLLAGLLAVSGAGLVILFSAGGQSEDLLTRQVVRIGFAFAVMLAGVFAISIGLVAGAYPSLKAARLTPVEALAG